MFEFGFVIGFITALAIVAAIGWLAGAARVARIAQALAGGRRRAVSVKSVVSPLESDVRAALVQMGAPAEAARRATAAAWQANTSREFEPLFRAALRQLPGPVQVSR